MRPRRLRQTGRVALRGTFHLALGIACASPCAALAADGAGSVQRFRYDAEASYAIVALPGAPTDLQLAPGEHVTGFALGDTLQWMVEELPGHVFVKPLKAGLFTAGTLVTDQRSYQLTLRSGRPRDEWMQRVSWTYPALVALRAPLPAVVEHDALAVPREPLGELPPVEEASGARVPAWPGAPGVDPVQLDFDYRVEGDAAFRPLAVFDDGHATWIRIPAGTELPVLYGEEADGSRLVHFAVRGDWLVAPRLAPAWSLKLGRAEVHLRRHPGGRAQAQLPPAGFWR